MGDAPIIPVLIIMIGGYLAWFGTHYFKSDTKWPTDPIKSALTGGTVTSVTYTQEQTQQANLQAYISSVNSPSSSSGAVSGSTSSIADDAQKYIGAGYVYGGNASKVGDWDCSSFVSYVLGHDLGLPLPGGKWGGPGMPPNAHGPTTTTYQFYGTAINQSQVQAGDLVIWSTHMGIAISPTEIVSAQDEKLGVGTSGIAATTASLGEPIVYFRRVPSA
jgi:cell wall-associated NlpC family hydrolase